jgi:hypothetical protein
MMVGEVISSLVGLRVAESVKKRVEELEDLECDERFFVLSIAAIA